ncbi:28S ribosomal protein S24, mitochondrial-like [Ostrea edulis]|uniref:28S ribosomal protein S24, mitochondrial-like n=1 Tax=Ostrea edulis TaxID=37623 RepID=UPI0024AF1099|nr:28S ribosomal protein S24, mitochondrial-like [Ostrea edulis]
MSFLSQRFLYCSQSYKGLSRAFCTSSHLCKNLRAGKKQYPRKGQHNFTYEEINPPYTIGVRKSWNSWNTTNLHGETGSPEIIFEDVFVRKFLAGTFPQTYDERNRIIIKHRQNLVDITMVVKENSRLLRHKALTELHFLQVYSEELLSRFLKRPVKLDIQCMNNEKVLKETVF